MNTEPREDRLKFVEELKQLAPTSNISTIANEYGDSAAVDWLSIIETRYELDAIDLRSKLFAKHPHLKQLVRHAREAAERLELDFSYLMRSHEYEEQQSNTIVDA